MRPFDWSSDNDSEELHQEPQSRFSDYIELQQLQRSKSKFNPYREMMYDVFVSAKHGTYRLDRALKRAGVYMCGSYYNLILLSRAIKGSRVSIIVFTTSYAGSTLCLYEMSKIMECRRSVGQQIVPVFYCVDPTDVRNQTGDFGKAFAASIRSTNQNSVLSYRTALQEAASITPRFVTDGRNERETMKNIVEHVTSLLDSSDLFIAEHLVGVQSHVQKLIEILNHQKSDDVRVLGIWGMAGIGKTTIAKAIYNQISRNFELRKFLPDLRNGCIIKRVHACPKRVFCVFDDVNDSRVKSNLPRLHEWYGPGSRIIITTRKIDLLDELGVDHIYRVNEMDYNECVELFSWHAFRKPSPERNLAGLIKHAVDYSDGLPLALVALGSILHERSVEEWESVLDQLKGSPIQDVLKVLRMSYDSLTSPEKQIFLELAYLSDHFNGMGRNYINLMFVRSEQSSIDTILELLEKNSLLTFGEKGKFHMHPLIQNMGREIYGRQSSITYQQKMYDVFLSFRGEDTRTKFISHLHASLQNASIHVFKDDDGLSRGSKLSISLLRAIRESKISIIVLSTNYANSRWCLEELENIMVCYRTKAHKVLPVFYDVDPSQVRNQVGEFGKAFENLLKRIVVRKDKEQSWRKALREVGCISGFVILNSRNESDDIKNIVDHVTHMLDMKDLFIANYPVGLEYRVGEVIKLLNNQQSKYPLILGIWGMGGIGKTTIAKAVYNKICRKFQGRCFLLNIREAWDQDNGGVRLQEQLLSDIYTTMKIKIQNIESGKSILEKRLGTKRILLVLDDVDKLEQLHALAASHKWFCPGSVIIITTRDEHLLTCLGVDKLYRMQCLDEKESIELFSWHAFREPSPREEFAQLSSKVVSYCGRLPLALEILGCHLFKRGESEWMSVLEQLKSIPDEKIQKKLKISFDGLSNEKYKEVFLDIAFFLIGMERNDVIDILIGCGYPAEIGISVLIEKSLVFVDVKNKLRMHDLLRDMGREIVREISPKAPEERTRVWNPEEGTKAIEGLALKLPRMNPVPLKTKAFKNMKRLKLLQLAGVHLDGDFKYMSTDIRWLSWHGCPSTYSTANFDQRNLVAIDFKYSNLHLVWKKGQVMSKLKILNLSHSEHLTKTPNFSYLPSLEKLILKDCPSLSSICHTIGDLQQILLINLKGCTSLKVLPRSIYKLKSLKTLILSGCTNIDKLEDDLEQMESLTTLMANDTAITQVPHALIRLKSIGYISLCGFEGLTRNVIPSIIWSWTSPSNNLSPQMKTSVDLSCLASITMPKSSCHSTSSSIINELPQFQKRRKLECSSQLQIPGDVALDTFDVRNFKEVEATATTSLNMDTTELGDVSESKRLLNSILIQMGMNCPVTEIIKERISQEFSGHSSVLGDGVLPHDKDPDWLIFYSEGFSLFFDVPLLNGGKLKTMMLSIVYSSSLNIVTSEGLILKKLLIINHTKATADVYKGSTLISLKDEDWQSVLSKLEPGDKMQIIVDLGHGFIVKKTEAYLIYE